MIKKIQKQTQRQKPQASFLPWKQNQPNGGREENFAKVSLNHFQDENKVNMTLNHFQDKNKVNVTLNHFQDENKIKF